LKLAVSVTMCELAVARRTQQPLTGVWMYLRRREEIAGSV
jgi:hypothetical protein